MENRRVVIWNKEVLRYKTELGTYFKVNGDLKRVLEVKADNLDYTFYWIRERLGKLENGQIKVVKGSSEGSRDWEQEEKIKKQMWEDINVNTFPKGIDFEDEVYYQCVKTKQKMNGDIGYWHEQHNTTVAPPKGPCRIS